MVCCKNLDDGEASFEGNNGNGGDFGVFGSVENGVLVGF